VALSRLGIDGRGSAQITTEEAADMTAIVLPDIDRSTLEELKKRIPDLSEIELTLPTRKEMSKTAKDVGKTAKEVGKSADETIDRLLGRKRTPVWPWIVAGIGLVAVAGVIAAWFAWFRRPTWQSPSEPWAAETYATEQTTVTTPTDSAFDDSASTLAGTSAGTTSSRASARKSTPETADAVPYPIEEA
jgi:hypothetical protein